MALIYGKPLESVPNTIPLPTIKKVTKQRVPWWLNLMISIGITIVAAVVTEGIGGVAGPIIGGAIETAGQVTNDVLSGYNDPLTISTDVIFSALPAISRAARVSKIAENPIEQVSRNLGKEALAKDIDDLARELQRVENLSKDGIRPRDFADDYLKNLAENNKLNAKYAIGMGDITPDLMASAEMQRMGTKQTLKDVRKFLNKANKLISLLDPSYAIRALARKVTAPIRKAINKEISEVMARMSKVIGISAKTARKALMHSVLPLNHTIAPWIVGIRLISIYNLPTAFHVEVIFDANLTNGKKSVMLWNKDFRTFIEPWLNTDSGGGYYLDNVAWGWEVGKFLRSNALFLGFTNIPYIQNFISYAFSARRIIARIEKLAHPEYWENKNNKMLKGILTGLVSGATSGIKGFSLVRATSNAIATGNKWYMLKWVGGKTKRYIRKSIRNRTNKKAFQYI